MIDRTKFAGIIAYIAAGTQKSLSDAGVEVYYSLLGDLPEAALLIAAKRAVLEHRYASFPPVAMLREFAMDTMRGQVKRMTGSEAWGIALKACGNCDVEAADSVERAFAKVPPAVKAATEAFGFMALYNLPANAMETARAQFVKLFDAIAEREQATGILPESVQQEILALGHAAATSSSFAKELAGKLPAIEVQK